MELLHNLLLQMVELLEFSPKGKNYYKIPQYDNLEAWNSGLLWVALLNEKLQSPRV